MPLLFLSHVLYSTLIDWLMFKGDIALVAHIALSEKFLTDYADQLLCNLSLTKLCSACAKQNTSVNACNACSLLAK